MIQQFSNDLGNSNMLSSQNISEYTDKYFSRTKQIVERFGDCQVTYAVFLRRPVISAPRLAIEFIQEQAKIKNTEFHIDIIQEEGKWVGAGEPIFYITGSFIELVELETLYLQKLGAACVAAWNAFTMAVELPYVSFMAMDARHCTGQDMAELMAYAASVGSKRAVRKANSMGFIGCANDSTAHYFDQKQGLGTMPHALVGYANSTLRAAEMFHESFPDQDLVVLVDYFGKEVTDALEVCRKFRSLAKKGKLSIRLDTSSSRFVEGLDPSASYAVLDRNSPSSIRGYRTDEELKHLVGPGVSAASIWYMREKLDEQGFNKVKIVASSGFNPHKCKVMSMAKVPVDVIGTGSYLPDKWSETYATADIIQYDNIKRVKVGREFLYRK